MFAWKLWLKGMAAAAIGGAATSATTALADPSVLRNPKGLALMTGVGAALSGLSYLKTHPPVDALPDNFEPLASAGIGLAANAVSQKLQKPKP